MGPEWWAKALEAELNGKLGHRPGFYNSCCQRLHHSVWSPQAKPQRLTKNIHTHTHTHAHRYSLSTLSMFTLFLCSSISMQTGIFVSCLTMQFASKDIPVVSMFLVLPSPNLTFTIPYLTYKHTDLSRFSEKFPPENNSRIKSSLCLFTRKSFCAAENSEQERNSSGDKRGLVR